MSVPPVARIRRVPPAEAHARKRDGAPAAVRLHRPRLDPGRRGVRPLPDHPARLRRRPVGAAGLRDDPFRLAQAAGPVPLTRRPPHVRPPPPVSRETTMPTVASPPPSPLRGEVRRQATAGEVREAEPRRRPAEAPSPRPAGRAESRRRGGQGGARRGPARRRGRRRTAGDFARPAGSLAPPTPPRSDPGGQPRVLRLDRPQRRAATADGPPVRPRARPVHPRLWAPAAGGRGRRRTGRGPGDRPGWTISTPPCSPGRRTTSGATSIR